MVAAQAGRAASAAPLDGNRRRRVANRNRQDGPTRQRERPGGRTHRNGTGSPVAAALRVPHERRRPGATPRTLGIQPPPQPSPTPAGEGDRGMGVGGQLLGPPEALRAARGRGVPPRPPRRRRPLLLGRLPQHRHQGALAGGEEAAPPEHLLPHSLPLRKDGRIPRVRSGRPAVAAQVAGQGCALLQGLRDGPGRIAEHRGGVQRGCHTGQREECCLHAMR